MTSAPPPSTAPPTFPARRNALLLLVDMLASVALLRLALHASPDQDFDVAGYNVHHLFTGSVLVALGGVPLALFPGGGLRRNLAVSPASASANAGNDRSNGRRIRQRGRGEAAAAEDRFRDRWRFREVFGSKGLFCRP